MIMTWTVTEVESVETDMKGLHVESEIEGAMMKDLIVKTGKDGQEGSGMTGAAKSRGQQRPRRPLQGLEEAEIGGADRRCQRVPCPVPTPLHPAQMQIM